MEFLGRLNNVQVSKVASCFHIFVMPSMIAAIVFISDRHHCLSDFQVESLMSDVPVPGAWSHSL